MAYFFSCEFWPKAPKVPVVLDVLLPKPKAFGVGAAGLPNADCVPVDVIPPKGDADDGAAEL